MQEIGSVLKKVEAKRQQASDYRRKRLKNSNARQQLHRTQPTEEVASAKTVSLERVNSVRTGAARLTEVFTRGTQIHDFPRSTSSSSSSLLSSSIFFTARVVGAQQIISQPVFSPFSPVLHCPLGPAELQACSFADVVFPPLPLYALSSSPFHCALQDGFG